MLTVSGLVIEAGAAAANVFAVEGDLAEDITKAVVPDEFTVEVGLGSSLILLKASHSSIRSSTAIIGLLYF